MANVGSASSPRTDIARNEGYTYVIVGVYRTRYSPLPLLYNLRYVRVGRG